MRFTGAVRRRVEDPLAQDRKVVGSMIGTRARLIIAEDDIHAPVQTVLDTPVLANDAV
ncbi:MAG: hypothetical protein JNL00_08500, partial [Candidatus Accumulibacter sp.]|nr:hypothetical protein [Accumulibacter sp.]